MKILVVGGGGREHAIIWKLRQSNKVKEIHCAPGNGGIAGIAKCVLIAATDIDGLTNYAQNESFNLVIVAPDDPLYLGLVDRLKQKGIRAFGPNASGARIEGSKVYAKRLMQKYGIPTAAYAVFSDYAKALEYIGGCALPAVIKADGLARGKGVIICETKERAKEALNDIMVKKIFGDAGGRVVIEEYIKGPEVSVLAFCDGTTILPMESAQDHKRAFDGDMGPNTGGMGTFSPSPEYTDAIREAVEETIIKRTARALAAEGIDYRGIIFFGLMLTEKGPKLLEYNARFGDPEAQAVLPRLKNDLTDIIDAALCGRLRDIKLEWDKRSAVCVVLASGGYPDSYEKGMPVTGLEDVEDALVFHAGTAIRDGVFVTDGGRVLGVTALGANIKAAREAAYRQAAKIKFEGVRYRGDIGIKQTSGEGK
ncbi:MAG: phosphoribosylamine--glycine ligase [Christensenellales bacterium]